MSENSAMVNILIAISLVLLAVLCIRVLGLAALILEGRHGNSGSDHSPRPRKEEDGR